MEETTRATVNIGVIGVGTWGKNHVRVLNELPGVKVVRISDVVESNMTRIAEVYKVPYTTEYKEVLDDPEVSAVSICTPASMHYVLVKEALSAGKHVLVEKPLTTSSRHGYELAELAEARKRILMVGHIFRFHPGVERVKEEIRKGTLGHIRFMYGNRMGLMTPRNDCGVITDFAIHDFDIFCYLLDEYPEEITAIGASYNNSKFEDVGFCTLGFSHNIKANVGVSWLTPKKVRDLWIIGDKKSLSLDYLSQEIQIYDKGMVPQYDSYGEFRLITQQGDDVRLFVPTKEPLKEELFHFVDCVRTNAKPKVGADIANKIVQLIEFANQSLTEKRTVRVDFRD
jgi:predicted dehydrogenase